MNSQKSQVSHQSLSRDDKKVKYIEKQFRQQEENQKKKMKFKHVNSSSEEHSKKEYCFILSFSSEELVLDKKRDKPEGKSMKFDTKEDFERNFGKEQWLKIYQINEINRNKSMNAKPRVDGLGKIYSKSNDKDLMKTLIENTKANQKNLSLIKQKKLH